MEESAKNVYIKGDTIALGQFLKFADVISTGGEAKSYLSSNEVYVNGEPDNRRGRKLHPGDTVTLKEGTFRILST